MKLPTLEYLTRPADGPYDVVRTFTKAIRITVDGWEDVEP